MGIRPLSFDYYIAYLSTYLENGIYEIRYTLAKVKTKKVFFENNQ